MDSLLSCFPLNVCSLEHCGLVYVEAVFLLLGCVRAQEYTRSPTHPRLIGTEVVSRCPGCQPRRCPPAYPPAVVSVVSRVHVPRYWGWTVALPSAGASPPHPLCSCQDLIRSDFFTFAKFVGVERCFAVLITFPWSTERLADPLACLPT